MATLRGFILNQSTLATGNIVRDHIKNPSTGGPGGSVLVDGLEVEMAESRYDLEITPSEVSVEITTELEVEVEVNEYTVEVSL